MQKHKRLFSLLIALAMILSLLPTMAFAADTDTTVYLKPNSNWTQANAWYAIYSWGSVTTWTTMADSDGDGYYEGTLPAGNTNLIFCRMNPASTTAGWSNCWNQTNDLTYDGTNNCYTVASGAWSNGSGSWSTYTPVTVPEFESPVVDGDSVTFNYWSSDTLTSVEVCGTINNWTMGSNYMTQDADTGIWSVTVSGLYNGTYQYKFVTDGADWINDPKNTGTQIGGNNTFTITDGLVDSNEPEYSSPVVEGSSVTFNYWSSEEITSVAVYGSMSENNWATAYTMAQDADTGIWSVTISDLYNGTYEYKIVVDGAWLVDPKNENIADSGNSYFEITESTDKPVVVRTATLHFQDTLSWGSVYAHIWNAGDYGTTWPGTAMTAEAGYTGWYTVSTTVTTETISLIFNNGTGGEGYQTGDLSITEIPESDCEYWYVPSADGWWTGTFETEAPETYVKEETASCQVTLHFKNTLAWDGINGYAWTNTWPATYPAEAWPGTALTEEDNWYTISFDATYVVGDGVYAIFNTVTGTDDYGYTTYAQTADLKIDCTGLESVEKWIIPTGTQTDYLSYECDIYDAEPIETAQVNGVTYYTVAEAIANANGGVITLVGDNYVATTIEADVTIDLAGHKLDEITVADGYSLTLIDTAGDDYTSDYCGVAYVTGTVNTFCQVEGKSYLTVANEYGQISAHRFDIALTHVSLKPADDALGYKAAVLGDEVVQSYVTNITISIGLSEDNMKSYNKENSGSVTLRLKNILACGGGEMDIYAQVAASLSVNGEEAQMSTEVYSTTMKKTIQAIDAAWGTYDATQQAAVKALVNAYATITDAWNLDNIQPSVDIPIE